jgi:Phosphotransferase enzyme family
VTAPIIARQADQGDEPANRPIGNDLRALLNLPGNRTVILDSSRDPNSGVTMLLIPAGTDQPELAVKLATTPAAAEVIDREARLLAELQCRPMGRVEPTLPQLAGVFHADGMLAVATTVVPGVPMRTRYHGFRHLRRPNAVQADFSAAGSWLADLHAASATGPRPISLLDGVPALITARWPDDPKARALARKLDSVASRLASASTPRTVVHGDFWAGNVLVTGDVVTGVVDWPAGQLSAEPLADVARFALSYALYLDRHTRPGRLVAGHPGLRADSWGAGIRYAIAGEHWFGQLVNRFVTGALDRLGAPPALWRDVLLAGIADVAVTADHADFALSHRDLLQQLISEGDL